MFFRSTLLLICVFILFTQYSVAFQRFIVSNNLRVNPLTAIYGSKLNNKVKTTSTNYKNSSINLCKIDCSDSNNNLKSKPNLISKHLNFFTPLFAAMALILLPSSSSYASVIDSIQEKATSSGLLQSYLLIFVSEIGDKTFFIAALLAAKYGRFISFSGSMLALAIMTVISTVLGQLFHAVPSSLTQGVPFDDYIAVLAFTYFGIKTLIDTSKIADGSTSSIEEEKAEAEELVEEVTSESEKRKSAIALILQVFSLVFAAEIGDKSFLSTIALSAALNPYAVGTGAIAAHASATGVAVIGGAILSKYLSEKVIGYVGGALFLVFAFTTAAGLF